MLQAECTMPSACQHAMQYTWSEIGRGGRAREAAIPSAQQASWARYLELNSVAKLCLSSHVIIHLQRSHAGSSCNTLLSIQSSPISSRSPACSQ